MTEIALAWTCPRCASPLEAAGQALECGTCGLAVARREGVWRFRPEVRPEGFRPERRDHLAAIEVEHFWFPPRRRLLAALLERAFDPPEAGAAIDLGCGNGGFLGELTARFATVVGVEAYPASLATARAQAPAAILVEGDLRQVPLASGRFDLAVALDVLEHLEPAALLGEARRLVRPGGGLLLSVPAFPALWSDLDDAAGHRCRYRRRDLCRELAASGWQLVDWTHYQAFLFPLVWLARKLRGGAVRRFERFPPGPVGSLLGRVNALEVRLLSGRRLRWGSSLCAVARKAA